MIVRVKPGSHSSLSVGGGFDAPLSTQLSASRFRFEYQPFFFICTSRILLGAFIGILLLDDTNSCFIILSTLIPYLSRSSISMYRNSTRYDFTCLLVDKVKH